jgi:hypothetical protein
VTDDAPQKAFARQAAFDQRELVGARWWFQGQRLAAAPAAQRRSLGAIAAAAGIIGGLGIIIAGGLLLTSGGTPDGGSFPIGRPLSLQRTGADDTTITRAALEAQRAEGWNVGSPDAALDYPDACDVDATGEAGAVAAVQGLAAELAPARAALAPWYVSTLFQCLELPANANLRAGLRPVFSPAMGAAFGRAEALRSLFEGVGSPSDIAIVADLPGPESVAFAAGLAPRFDAVFTFDNWPHPRGVVPAHLTLAAAVYYRRWFASHAPAPLAPPLFVLDRNRLVPYVDDAGRFDNRHLAKLPGADGLKALGVKHVLYVVPGGDATRELDDLNDEFVTLNAAGFDIKVLALSDLEEPKDSPAVASRPGVAVTHAYRYGGRPTTHWWFWNHYGWHTPPAGLPAEEPSAVSRGFDYAPSPRPTLFSSGHPAGAAGPVLPRGFGTVTFHSPSESSGRGSTGNSGRSGTFGRGGTSVGG